MQKVEWLVTFMAKDGGFDFRFLFDENKIPTKDDVLGIFMSNGTEEDEKFNRPWVPYLQMETLRKAN